MSRADVRVFGSVSEVAREAAEFFAWLVEQARRQDKPPLFHTALSGGSTPRSLYACLAREYATRLDWSLVRFYFGDERCVPPDHAESNFKAANDALFGPLRIPSGSVFRIDGEDRDPDAAARHYERTIRQQVPSGHAGWPQFDLMLLGLGADGHTASLFPHSPALKEQDRAVVATDSPRGVTRRITATPPLINAARTVLFLVTGAEKAAAVARTLESRVDPMECPARLVQAPAGRLVWYLDQPAAAGLASAKQQIEFDEE